MLHLGINVTAQPFGANWWPEGAQFAADFALSRYMRSGLAVPFDTACRFTRPTIAYAETASGTIRAFGVDEPRTTGRGLLIEPAARNALLRSSGFGFAADWTPSGMAGVTGRTRSFGALVLEECTVGASTGNAQWSHFKSSGVLELDDGAYGVVSHYCMAGDSPVTRTHVHDGGSPGHTATEWSWTDGAPSVVRELANSAGRTALIENGKRALGHGVWRLWTVFRNIAGEPLTYAAWPHISSDDPNSYASACWMGGHQLEGGNMPTSPIITSGTARERGTETLSLMLPHGLQTLELSFIDGAFETVPAPAAPYDLTGGPHHLAEAIAD